MRNLKKVLALVLVLVMTMSVMTFAGAYSDVDNSEAINVMSAVGVFNGYEDGTFKPNKVLTREEAMKIVSYLDLTKSVADTLPKDGGVFTDVEAGRWSAGYIAYAYNVGVVNGNGDGTFGPTAELKGTAFAKMVLNVLGIEGEYTGLLWELNVKNALKANKELLVGLEKVDLSQPMTRAQAAQLAFNALWVTTGSEVATGKYVISVVAGSAFETELNEIAKIKFATSLEAMLTVSSVCEDAKLGKDYTVGAEYAPDYTKALAGDHDVRPYSVTDEFGVDTTGHCSISVDKKGNPVAIYTATAESGHTFADETMTGKALHAAYVGDAKKTINVTVYTNGIDNVETFVASKDSKDVIGGKGVVTTVYETATGLKVVEVETFLAKVSELIAEVKDNPKTEQDESAPAKAVLAFDGITDVIETEDYKVGDYLLVTAANGKIKTYEDPTIVAGKMVGYKGTTSVTLDSGKTLEWAKNSVIKSVNNYKDDLKFLTDGLYAYGLDDRTGGAPVVDPVDGYAKVLAWQVSYAAGESNKDLFGETVKDETCAAKAKVQFQDGSVEVVDVTVIYVDKKAATEAMPEGYYVVNPVTFETVAADEIEAGQKTVDAPVWASYRETEDGTYSFCAVEGAVVINAELAKGTKTLGGYRLNSYTKYVEYNTHKDVKASVEMVGYNKIATAEKTDLLVFVNEKTNVITEMYSIVNVAPKQESTDVELEDLYYAVEETDEGNVYGIKWNFTVNGEEVSYISSIELVEGTLYELTINEKNVVIAAKAVELTEAGKVEFIDELYFDAANGSYDFAAEYVVYNAETGLEDTLEVGDTASVLTKVVKDQTVVVVIFVEKAPKEA